MFFFCVVCVPSSFRLGFLTCYGASLALGLSAPPPRYRVVFSPSNRGPNGVASSLGVLGKRWKSEVLTFSGLT